MYLQAIVSMVSNFIYIIIYANNRHVQYITTWNYFDRAYLITDL